MTSEADTKFWKRPIVVAFTLFLIGAFTDPTLNTGWGVLVGALLFVFGALSIVLGIRELRPRGRKKGKRRVPIQRNGGQASLISVGLQPGSDCGSRDC